MNSIALAAGIECCFMEALSMPFSVDPNHGAGGSPSSVTRPR